jgi:hypothetical protein
MQQINLKLPESLLSAASSYVEHFGYKNIQELATVAIREKVFDKNEYDETFSDEEIELIDELIAVSLKKGLIYSEEEYKKILEE